MIRVDAGGGPASLTRGPLKKILAALRAHEFVCRTDIASDYASIGLPEEVVANRLARFGPLTPGNRLWLSFTG